MNVGLILTPVSIYQMSRGALVLWVGVLSVIFLRRHLWLYQWTALVIVVLGVCLVGLSGSLVKKTLDETTLDGLVRIATSDDEPAKVALGVILILFAQNFTACQYVSTNSPRYYRVAADHQVVEEKIMSRYKVAPLVSLASMTDRQSLTIIGGRHTRRLFRPSDDPSSHAFPASIPSKQIPLFRHTTRLAPDHLEPDCHVAVICDLYQYR